jgi:L-lactate utilization protein LutC
MSTASETTIEPPVNRGFDTLADEDTVRRTAAALEANGMTVLRATDAADARRIVTSLIPEGSQVSHGASQTLDVTGITALLDESGRYEALGPRVRSMDRATQGDEIRRLSSTPDVMLGSVHAVTETGSVMAASMSGSQLAPYVAGAGQVVFVVGTQKIVPDLDAGLRRIYDYAFPLEDARAQAAYGIHSSVSKIVIINREINPGRITVVLVDEALGF